MTVLVSTGRSEFDRLIVAEANKLSPSTYKFSTDIDEPSLVLTTLDFYPMVAGLAPVILLTDDRYALDEMEDVLDISAFPTDSDGIRRIVYKTGIALVNIGSI